MNKEQAIQYCLDSQEKYFEHNTMDEDSIATYNGVIQGLRDGTVQPDELPDYGFDWEVLPVFEFEVDMKISNRLKPGNWFQRKIWWKLFPSKHPLRTD